MCGTKEMSLYVRQLTDRMWFSSSVDMASAYSVFSLAMRVRLLISGLLFILKSCRASRKSAATSAAGKDMMGKLVLGLEGYEMC